MTNKSASEIAESLPLKTFSLMLQMLLEKIDLSSEKNLCHSNILDLSNIEN